MIVISLYIASILLIVMSSNVRAPPNTTINLFDILGRKLTQITPAPYTNSCTITLPSALIGTVGLTTSTIYGNSYSTVCVLR